MVLNLIVLAVVLAIALLYLADRRAARHGASTRSSDGKRQAKVGALDSSATPAADGVPTDAIGGAPALAGYRGESAAEADALLESARREADAVRRAAAAEAEALRSEAALEIQAAGAEARRLRDEARADSEAVAAAARRDADALAATLRREAEAASAAELEQRTADVRQAQARLAEAEREAVQRRRDAEADAERSRLDAQARAQQLALDERELVQARAAFERREGDLAHAESSVAERISELDERDRGLAVAAQAAQSRQREEMERIAGLSAQDARAEVLRAAENVARRDAARLARDIEAGAAAEAQTRARQIVAESIQRVASEQTAETVVSVMPLASDELKGRIIGREGRNIRAFEAVTGVNVIIDDTPEAVLLSCFDPVRREVGRLTLETLLADGRIHPHRIEEVYERSVDEVDKLCRAAAQEALLELGIDDIDPELIPTIGRLRYRTSYGQNVLAHSVESGHIAGIMAAELGIAPVIVRRSAFLHDIGKALTHEAEGSHAIVGAALLRRHGESEVVAHAVEAHHNEVPATSIEDVLTQAADACSAARPGARRESIEAYVKRLARIEEIASAREGVEKVFAMQAGREVRVMVRPDAIDDLEAGIIAREIAKQIEDELTYPGQIRVTVIRESRASEIAH